MLPEPQIILRLVVAAVLGSIVGIERQTWRVAQGRSARVRQ